MLEFNPLQPNYLSPTTTANSAGDGRLKVGVSEKKKKIIKKHLTKHKNGKI